MVSLKFTLQIYIFCSLLLLFALKTINKQNLLCRYQQEICGPCAICIKKYNYKDYCLGTFFYPLYNDTRLCRYTDNCAENYCQYSSPCITMYGSFSCECDTEHHGHHCEYTKLDGRTYAKGIGIVYSPIVVPLETTYILVCLEDLGSYFKLLFKDGEQGFVQRFTSPIFERGNPRRICLRNKIASYSVCEFLPDDYDFYVIKLPMTYSIYRSRIWRSSLIEEKYPTRYSATPVGYVSNFEITIVNDIHIQFQAVYPRFIAYPEGSFNLTCLPQIGFQNCAYTYKDPTILHRSTETAILLIITNTRDRKCTSPIINWKIWKHFDNHIEDQAEYVIKFENLMKYAICPYCLATGKYKVKVTVDIPYKEYNVQKKSTNLGYCFFQILKLPLIAVIEGGDSRSTYAESDLILDASRSKDHNQPPDNQNHIIFTWSCDKDYYFCKNHTTKSRKYRIPGPFQMGQMLNFTLEVAATGLTKAYASQVVTMTSSYQTNWLITCLWNCGRHNYESNPDSITYLLITAESEAADVIDDFYWTFDEDGYKEQNASIIAQDNIPNFILIVQNGAFFEGKKYTITATRKSYTGKATINIVMGKRPKLGTCSVTPIIKKHMKVMKYMIVCDNFQTNVKNSILTYNFRSINYDDETVGIPLGQNSIGLLKGVALVLPRVIIRAYDSNGMHVLAFTDVVLQKNMTTTYESSMDLFLTELKTLLDTGDQKVTLRLVATYAHALRTQSNRLHYLWELLNIINKALIYTPDDMELILSALLRILEYGTYNEEFGMDRNSVFLASSLLEKVSKQLSRYMISSYNDDTTIFIEDIKRIGQSIFLAVNIILKSRGELRLKTIDEETSTDMYKKLRDSSIMMELVLQRILRTFRLRLLPAETEIKLITEKSTAWIKMDTPQRLSNLKKIPYKSSSFLLISKALAEELRETWMFFSVETLILSLNPFWWDIDDVPIGSEFMLVTIRTCLFNMSFTDDKLVTNMSNVIDLYIKINTHFFQTIHGSVTMPDPYVREADKDSAVQVYRLTPPDKSGHAYVKIVFVKIPKNTTLRVLMRHGIRPDFKMMMEYGNDVTFNKTHHELSIYNYNPNEFVYIGVLPSHNTKAGVTVEYKFDIEQIQCHDRQGTTWGTDNCKVGYSYNDYQVHCRCSHLSLFAVSFPVMPIRLDHFKEYNFLIIVKINLFLTIFILCILLLYVVLFICSLYMDRKNKEKAYIMILNDNYPGDKWPYLVTVFTGAKLFSRCESNVGVQIHGQLSSSRVHILQKDDQQKIFQCHSDDWFLLYTPERLGEIKSIHIWRDDVGCFPNWYCDKVIVHDVLLNEDYVFLIEEWLCVDYPHEMLEVTRSPATAEEKCALKRLFNDNFIHVLREEYLWISIITHHPRSFLRRTERLSVLMCVIMLIVASSIIFLVFAEGEGVDSPSYKITYVEVIKAVKCHLIAVVISNLVLLLFKWSVTDNVPNKIVHDLEEQDINKTIQSRKISVIYQNLTHEDAKQNRSTESLDDLKDEVKQKVENLDQLTVEDKKQGIMARISNSWKHVKFYVQQDKLNLKRLDTYKKAVQYVMRSVDKIICYKPLMPISVRGDKHSYITVHPIRKILAWFCCISVIIICAVIGMKSGSTIGNVDSQMWITIIIMAIGQCICITTPLTIVVCCLIYSVVLQKRINTNKYVCNYEKWLPELTNESAEHMEKVLKLRSRPIYQPLDMTETNKLRIIKRKHQLMFILLEIILIISYILCVFLSAMKLIHITNIANLHVRHMLSKFEEYTPQNFKNNTVLNLYIVNILLPSIHTLYWYNHQPIDKPGRFYANLFMCIIEINFYNVGTGAYFNNTGWAADYTHKLIGIPHLRQWRSKIGVCHVSPLTQSFIKECHGNAFSFVEDNKNYALGWKPLFEEPKVVTPWTYLHRENSTSSSHSGVTGNRYHSGGYVANISRTLKVSRKIIWKLEESEWIDARTRVLFIELTLYNVNLNWLSEVTILLEYISGAGYITLYKVMSTKYTFHFEYTHLLVVFFTLFFLFQIILGYNRLGKKYCAQYLNLLNYPIVFFSMGMIISLLLQKYLTESKISDFQSEGHETFFSFFQYKTFSRFLLNCQLLIIISLTLKLLFLGQVGQMSKNCMYTLILAKQQIFITCCLLVPLSWLMSAPISYLLGTQLFPQTTAVIFNRLSFKKVSQNSVFSHVKLPTVLFSFIHSFMSFVCTAFIVHFHLTVKGYTKNVKSEVNPFKFAFDQLKLICCRKHAYRKVRLRGGADLEFSSRKSKNINIKTCFVSAYLMCRVKQTEPKKVCSTLGEHLFKTVKYSKSYHNSLTKVYCEDVLYKLDVISKTINELN